MATERRDTIIYGGFFNPPTRAHHAILQACVKHAKTIDADVWVLPCGNRPHKSVDIPVEQRIGYVEAMIRDVEQNGVDVQIEAYELNRGGINEAYDIAREFETMYPDRRFVWVFGSDSYVTIEQWKQGAWLKENLPVLVVERPGVPVGQLGENVSRLAVKTPEGSSSEVRQRILANQPVDDLVTPSVLEYLQP